MYCKYIMSRNPNPAGQQPDYSFSSTLSTTTTPIKQAPPAIPLTAPTDAPPISTVLGNSQQFETLNQGGYVSYQGGYVNSSGKGTGTLIETPTNKAMYIAAAAVLVIVLFNIKKR